jgi:hypothetical protein
MTNRRSSLNRFGTLAATALVALTTLTCPVLAQPGGGGDGGGTTTPTPAQIAARAARRMHLVVHETAHQLRRVASVGSRQVMQVRRDGGDAAAVTAAVDAAIARINTRAAAGQTRIDTIKTDALTRVGTDATDAIASINAAATRATDALNAAKTRAIDAVNRAATAPLP